MTSPSEPVAAGDAVVEQSPLRTTFIRSHNRFVLSWPNDSALVIKNHLVVRVVAWVLCILGWPLLSLGLLGLIGSLMNPQTAEFVAAGLMLLCGSPFVLMGVWLLGPRYRFDAADGWMTARHFWRTRRRPLAQIVAVQMIDAGLFGTKFNEGLDGDSRVKFFSYQLNLVLDDPNEPRVFVTYNSDFTDMARKAKILADFLSVPLLAAPRVHELVQTYCAQDARALPAVSGARRFRGSDALRSVPDHRLPEPYRSWIDEAQRLPAHVRLLPRSVAVIHDLSLFVILGVMIVGMDVLIVVLFLPVLAAAGGWLPVLVVGAVCLLLALIPLYLLRRLIITLGAWRRLKRGTLRQGILVGPEGVLVRMEPNRCHAIALDRFVNAKIEASVSADIPSDFVIETLDGPVAFFLDRSSGRPEQINQWVSELRSGFLPLASAAHAGEPSVQRREGPERPAMRLGMVDMKQLLKIREQLDKSGRIREVLDDEGKVRPSQSAMEWVARENAGDSEAEKYGLAQCLTLLELADKYREEMN